MWTPKRIVLLAVGFFVFFSGYMLYASCLGGIDGLPPLPLADYPSEGGPGSDPMPPTQALKLEDKLRQAFGQDCQELKWAMKLEMNAKNMVVASRDFTIEDDGRLKLDMISLAMFSKDAGDGRGAEINTVRAKQAFLTFDKPFGKNEKDFTGRRIVAAELSDDIEVVNNHHTPQRDDDLHLIIDKGPLFYDEAKHLIWTDDNVHVEDDQNQPPTDVRGQGMEVHLAAAEVQPNAKPAAHGKFRGESFSGVESIVLKANVDMHLWVSGGGFLSNPPAPNAKAPPAAKPPEKAELVIYTPGRFEYQLHKEGDLALFDVPKDDPNHPDGGQQPVSVDRVTATPDGKGQLHDQLQCRRLELRLRPKNGAAAPPHDNASPDRSLEVESAHATATGAYEVVLTSDSQKLVAHGNDFQFDAKTKHTLLRGDPARPDSGMSADQDGNKIHAHDLQIQEQLGADGRAWRQVTAQGPGRIDFKSNPSITDANTDKTAKKPDAKSDKAPLHAIWQDKLVSTKDGAQDLMILTGSASFADDEREQTLQAETLKVWLISPDSVPAPAGQGEEGTRGQGDKGRDATTTVASSPLPLVPSSPLPVVTATANPQQGRRPSHVEASGNVSAHSHEMNIPHAGQLVVVFRDVPAAALPVSAPAPVGQGEEGTRGQGDKGTKAQEDKDKDGTAAVPTVPLSPLPLVPSSPLPTTPVAGKDEPEPAKPIDLTARSVYAWVARADQKSALEKLQAEGDVEVHQDPAKADEKGVDVKGDALEMTCHPDGNFLVVQGDLAQLRMDKIFIIGPEVNIDQASNKAWVWGAGAMQMESESNFQGEKLAKPVPLTVEWNKEMFFNGRYAEFTEHVQAEQEEQDNAHLACESLQVFFDHSISLKEGNHGGPPPRVNKMVCSDHVVVEEKTMAGTKVVRFQRITGGLLYMNALEPEDIGVAPAQAGSDGNEIHAPGPGELRLFQSGGQDPLAPPPAPGARVTAAKPTGDGKAPAAAKDDAMKMTYITYGGSMYANSKTNKATFIGNVRVLSMPCDNPNIQIDLDDILNALPEGAMYLRADGLKVFDNGDRTTSQKEMDAHGHVLVQAKDFWGRSNEMTYNEAKDQIIFKGGEGGLATLYKIKQKGAPPQKIMGKEIIYIRSTGMFQIEGGEWISGSGN